MKTTKSLRGYVLETVLALGECSVGQVAAKVGKSIDARSAFRAVRRNARAQAQLGKEPYPNGNQYDLANQGRKRMVKEALGRLCREEKIRRVSRGVYAPIAPRISGNGAT